MITPRDVILPLPDKLVARSHGFALDIGGSIAKVLYRSKDEYKGGQPRDKKNGGPGLHMVSFPRDDIDFVINILKEKCDVTRDQSGLADIHTMGFGGNLYKRKLEGALDVRIHNESEFNCFSEALAKLSKHVSKEDMFLPLNEEVFTFVSKMNEWFKKVRDQEPELGEEFIDIPEPYTLPDDPEDYFPCLLVLAGSGNPFLKVEKDGTNRNINFPILGGRFLQGFSKLCCGVENFYEMEQLIARSNQGETCDALPVDLVEKPAEHEKKTDDADDELDAYAVWAEGAESLGRGPTGKVRVFPFGKATMPGFNVEQTTKGDMLYSMQRSVAEGIAQTAFYATFRCEVKNVFFVGNFVSIPRVRDFITEQFHIHNLKIKPGERRNFRFVKNGGHLGAIGGYLYEKKH